MENLHAQIIDYLLTQSWQIGVLAVAIAAVSLAVKNKSAHVRYLLWLIVLAKCLVPPLYTITLAVLPQQEIPEPVVTTPVEMPVVEVEAVEVMQGEPVTLPAVPVVMRPPAEPSIAERLAEVTVRQWLAFVWIIGVGVFVLAAVIKALRVNQWLRRERRALPAKLQSGIEKLFAELGVKTVPKVWLVEGIGQPFVWGLLRGSIYLPGNFVGVTGDESRRGVLGHELSHILRFDAAVNLLQIIAQAIFWFHPFVWWTNKKIRAEREKCCDEMAIARLGAGAKDYSSAIVNTLIAEHEAALPVPSLAVSGPVRNIEDRIKAIMRPGRRFYRRPSLIVAITVFVLALIAVPTTLALTARGAKSPEKIDVETILEQVRKAQRPEENMRIEWVRETDLAHYWGWTKKRRPTKEPVIEKSNAVISGKRSRIERREEYYEGEVAGEPLRVQYATSVFDGNEQRRLNELGKGYERGGKSGYIALEERNTSLLKELLFGSNPLQHSKGRLEEYKFKLELLENEVPGIYVLKITKPEGQLYDLITVDGNRGYNIVKRELFRSSDDVKLMGDDYELKKYPNGIWFLGKREKVGYTSGLDVLAKPRLEEKITITNVRFGTPEPGDEMFKLDFPPGARVHILGIRESEIVIGKDGEEELRRVIESAEKLKGLGRALIVYANDDEEGRFPDTLEELHQGDYVSEKDLEWLLENIGYLGKGKTATDSPGTAIAYDKALLRKGKGTNVLFLDGHVAFERPEQLEKLGIASEPAWGVAVEGLQCRLRPDGTKWQAGETPTLKADIRNLGTHQLYVVQHQGLCELWRDGRWYGWAGGISAKSSPLGQGREYNDIPILLDEHWVSKSNGKPLRLRRRHIVRVAFITESEQGEVIRVHSNPVEIEILPKEVGSDSSIRGAEREAEARRTRAMGHRRRISFIGLDLTDAPRTTNQADLPDLFEERPVGSGSYALRDEVVAARHPEFWEEGVVYYVAQKKQFYIIEEPGHPGSGSKTFYGPFAGEPWKRFGMAEPRPVKKQYRFAIYLVVDPIDVSHPEDVTLEQLRLGSVPVLTEEDIVEYDWNEHFLKLTPEAWKRVPSPRSVWGLPFVVVADGQRCYLGAFWAHLSSYMPKVPFIGGFRPGWRENKIQISPPEPIAGMKDPRNDPQVRKVLEELDIAKRAKMPKAGTDAPAWGEAVDGLRCRWFGAVKEVRAGAAALVGMEIENVSGEEIFWQCREGTWLIRHPQATPGTPAGTSPRFEVSLGEGVRGATTEEAQRHHEGSGSAIGYYVLEPGAKMIITAAYPYPLVESGPVEVEGFLHRENPGGGGGYFVGQVLRNVMTCPLLVLEIVGGVKKPVIEGLSVFVDCVEPHAKTAGELELVVGIENASGGEVELDYGTDFPIVVLEMVSQESGPHFLCTKEGGWYGTGRVRKALKNNENKSRTIHVSDCWRLYGGRPILSPGRYRVIAKVGRITPEGALVEAESEPIWVTISEWPWGEALEGVRVRLRAELIE